MTPKSVRRHVTASVAQGVNSPPPDVGAGAGVLVAGELPTAPGPNSVLPGGAGDGGGLELVGEGERWPFASRAGAREEVCVGSGVTVGRGAGGDLLVWLMSRRGRDSRLLRAVA